MEQSITGKGHLQIGRINASLTELLTNFYFIPLYNFWGLAIQISKTTDEVYINY